MCPTLHLGPFTFYTFGLVVGCAICLGTATFLRYFERHHIPVNPPLLTICLVAAGILGAKLDNAIFIGILVLHGHPFRGDIRVLAHGYTYLGALLGGMLAAAFYVHFNRLPWLRVFDATFCVAPAYALGRIGCFLAGDGDYGVASNLPWAMSFPHGMVPTLSRVHPTMLYSAVYELIVFATLWKLSSRRSIAVPPGFLAGLYLVLTSAGRFLVEFLSRNPHPAFGLTEAQLVSVGLACSGIALILAVRFGPDRDCQHLDAATEAA